MERNVKQTLTQLGSLYRKKHIVGSPNAKLVEDGEKYLKTFVDRICRQNGLFFDKRGFNFRLKSKGYSIYKKRILCRIFNNDESKSYDFSLLIYFNTIDQVAGIKIDRDSNRLGVNVNSKEDKQYKSQIDNKVKELVKKHYSINNYDVENEVFSFKSDYATDINFIKFLNKKLKFLLPIYHQICKEKFSFVRSYKIEVKPRPNLNLKEFKIISAICLSANEDDERIVNKRIPPVDPEKMAIREFENTEVGKQGEKLVRDELKRMKRRKEIIEYKLVNGNADEGGSDALGYDFKFVDKNHKQYCLEVKTSAKDRIFISKNELDTLKENIDRYFVWIVDLKRKAIYKIPGKMIAGLPKPYLYKYKINPDDFKN